LLEPTLLVCAGYLAAANQKLQYIFKFCLLAQSTPRTVFQGKLLGDILYTSCRGNMVADFKDLEVLGATLKISELLNSELCFSLQLQEV
jgi:hypothetical protein